MDLPSSAKILLSGLIAAWILKKFASREKGLPYPPGPKGYLIIGNLFDLSTEYVWIGAYDLRKTYGDLVFFKILGKPILFLNSYQAMSDLLDKRSGVYGHKPNSVMINDLLDWGWLVAVMPYGERWRKHRQQLHPFLEPNAVKRYVERQESDAHILLKSLLVNPEDFLSHIRRQIGSTIMMLVYGYEVEPQDDPYIKIIEEGMEYITRATVPGAFLVEMFSWLKHVPEWVPGAGFQRFAREGSKMSFAMKMKPYDFVKERISDGTAKACITSEMIEANRKEDGTIENEDIIANVSGVLYAGGADTAVSVLQTFFLCMALNPEVQRRAHEELDQVIGKSRLPTLEDKPNLPYINAICLECLRFYPVTPFGSPREMNEDDEYRGYLIPKGTIVVPNIWGVFNDSEEYPDPSEFKPERFLPNEKGRMPLDPVKAAFGFGRRMCPGRHMALNTIFLNISSVLSVFDIKPVKGEDGKLQIPNVEYVSSAISYPKPFKCSITPRSSSIVDIIKQM